MRRQNESFGELLFKAPWWISAAIGVVAFAVLHWGVPVWAGSDNLRQTFAKGIAPLALLLLIAFGILAAGSFYFGKHRRRLVDQQTSLESLRAIPWKQFEFLVAEALSPITSKPTSPGRIKTGHSEALNSYQVS